LVEDSSARGRLVRRAAGLGAAALFFSGLLVALGLEELVIAAALVGALGTLVAGAAWLVVVHRDRVVRATATGYAAAAPILAGVSSMTRVLAAGLGSTPARAGRAASFATAAGFAACVRGGRRIARRAAPLTQSAMELLTLRLRVVAGSVRRQASKGAAVVAADFSHHRRALRGTRTRPCAERRRRPDRAISRRLSGAASARARSRAEDDGYRARPVLPRLPIDDQVEFTSGERRHGRGVKPAEAAADE